MSPPSPTTSGSASLPVNEAAKPTAARRWLVIGLVASLVLNGALGGYVYFGTVSYSRLLGSHRHTLETHAHSFHNGSEHGSHVEYKPTPDELQQHGIRFCWCKDGYVFYLLPPLSGIDVPEQFIVFDTQSRGNAPRTIMNMYPNFMVYDIGYTDYPSWYYLKARK